MRFVSRRSVGLRNVYDITVDEHHNFVAGGMVVHNSGAQRFIQRFQPKSLEEIAIATSIYRPGPLNAKVDDLYLKAKEDPAKAEAECHPKVWEVLKPTKGCLIFQEGLMLLAQHVAGFPAEDTERVRKTILKQSITAKGANKEKRAQIRKEFVDGCVSHSGMKRTEAEALFDKIEFFCGYGFNRSCHFSTLIDTYSHNAEFLTCKMIADIKPGECVRSRDEKTKSDIFVEVKTLHDHGELDLYEFTMSDGSTTTCSLDHKFCVIDGRILPIKEILVEGLEIVKSKVQT